MAGGNARKISFTGVHKLDLVIYAALVLRVLEHRVLVCDKTRRNELRNSILQPERQMDLVNYKEIDFCFSELAGLEDSYDYIFFVQDFAERRMEQAQKIIYICDGLRENAEQLIQELERVKRTEPQFQCMILYRNLYNSYGIDMIKESAGITQENEMILTCVHDCMDEAGYQEMQYRPFSHISQISEELEKGLKELLWFIGGIDERTIKRGIKMAKRGRIH